MSIWQNSDGKTAAVTSQEAEDGRDEKRRRHDLRELRPLDSHRDARRRGRHRDDGPHHRDDRDHDLFER